MSHTHTLPDNQSQVWKWRLSAGLLILGTAVLRIIYLAYYCPLDLAPDEAHYWDWSRNLDWSYYSKGPLVAYLIRLSCWLTGDWSVQVTGSQMVAVRLPAVVCGSFLLLGLYVLATQIYRRESFSFGLIVLALTMPVLAAGSLIMTIDSPYTCCWCWALVAAYQAIFRKSGWAWPVMGILVGLGMLAKYTMVLWYPSLGLFLLFSGTYRRLLWKPGLWISVLVAFLFCSPILYWNFLHNWIGFLHVNQLSGIRSTETHINWIGPLKFAATQFALFLGFWFVFWLQSMWVYAPWRPASPEQRYLWWMSAPMFLLFFFFGFTTNGGEANWAIACYLSGLVLAAGYLIQVWQTGSTVTRRFVWCGTFGTSFLGIMLIVASHNPLLTQPVLVRLAGNPTEKQKYPIRRIDPTCRLRGWQTLAEAVDDRVAALRRQGIEPVIAADSWVAPGELAFYCQGNPTVYTLGVLVGNRHSQYDLWRPNPIADPEKFRGKTFIYVGFYTKKISGAFRDYEKPDMVYHIEDGCPISEWQITIFRNFQGFPRTVSKSESY